MRTLFVGDIVRLKVGMLGKDIGVRGVVYEEYDIGDGPGVSVIFGNGEHDGFSVEEQSEFLEKVDHSMALEGYVFTNVMKLSQHFRSGVFNITKEGA